MSPNCDNCDGFVTPAYVRVFAPPGADTVRTCPNCPDKLRSTSATGGEEVREPRSPRRGSEGDSN